MDDWCAATASRSGRSVEAYGDVDVLRSKDGHDHARQPRGHRVPAHDRIEEAGWSSGQSRLAADETRRPPDSVLAKQRDSGSTSTHRATSCVLGETRRRGWNREGTDAQGPPATRSQLVAADGGQAPPDLSPGGPRAPSGGQNSGPFARDSQGSGGLPQGVVKEGHAPPLRPAASDGGSARRVTGDKPTPAAKIADESGWTTSWPRPSRRKLGESARSSGGRLVAMNGDGTTTPRRWRRRRRSGHDTERSAREAGNMGALDSNPTKLIEIVEIGKK